MNVLHLVGRIFFGMIFVFNGLNHFMRLDMLTDYAASMGVPAPSVAVIITGLLLLLGGLAVIFGYQRRFGLWMLIIFLIPVALIMHPFWAVPAEQQMAQMSHFFKNFALAGGAMMLLLNLDRAWPYSLGGSSGGNVGGTEADVG
ncbi:MAG: DoxX family protein [Longimicrobiales bacterium]